MTLICQRLITLVSEQNDALKLHVDLTRFGDITLLFLYLSFDYKSNQFLTVTLLAIILLYILRFSYAKTITVVNASMIIFNLNAPHLLFRGS